MWELAQLEPDDPDDPFKNPLKYFDWPTRTDEYFRFKTGKPTVRLQVTTNGDPMLYFRLRMDEGGMFIFTSQDPRDDEHIEWEIDNWVFAFSVKICKAVCICFNDHHSSSVNSQKRDHQRIGRVQRVQGACRTPQFQLHPGCIIHRCI